MGCDSRNRMGGNRIHCERKVAPDGMRGKLRISTPERHASEIRVRAERRCGELLTETPKAVGGNPNLSKDTTGCQAQTLAALGITKRPSSATQRRSIREDYAWAAKHLS